MNNDNKTYVVKKSGNKEVYDPSKIIRAVRLAASRTDEGLSTDMEDTLLESIMSTIKPYTEGSTVELSTEDMHNIVTRTLKGINTKVAIEYLSYRNYKGDLAKYNDILNDYVELGRKVLSNTDYPKTYMVGLPDVLLKRISDSYKRIDDESISSASLLYAVIQDGVRDDNEDVAVAISSSSGSSLLLSLINLYLDNIR